MVSKEEGQPYSRRQEGIPKALVMRVDVAQTQSWGAWSEEIQKILI